ncbi:MAG TPA: non-canonical purine NTP pyrophosphatase [Gemmatimonadales bacterium]|nr:non-canonical purine NTP pyrophosphatase [Gemmatimonadales bacterium]
MKLLVGTRSPGKTREIRELFAGLPFELSFPGERLLKPLPEEADLERSMSYVENAVAKARYFATRGGLPAVADDSGIEVDALGGAPGPRSARWSATGGDAENNSLLLAQLKGVPEEKRTARYRCVVGFVATASSVPEIVEATCDGFILTAPRGAGGFGYDPLFYSPELKMTFAEAPPAAKHRVSHRGRAFRALIEVLLRRMSNDQ